MPTVNHVDARAATAKPHRVVPLPLLARCQEEQIV